MGSIDVAIMNIFGNKEITAYSKGLNLGILKTPLLKFALVSYNLETNIIKMLCYILSSNGLEY